LRFAERGRWPFQLESPKHMQPLSFHVL
jgi:hypothetical protein